MKKDAYGGTNERYGCAQACMYVHLCTAECFCIGECAYPQTDLLLSLITLPPPPRFAVVTEKRLANALYHFTTSHFWAIYRLCSHPDSDLEQED